MINFGSEQVVTMTEACKLLPCRRRGKKPNVATLYRWANAGVRGMRLESIMVGGTRRTSVEAIQRFFDRLTLKRNEEYGITPDAPVMSGSADIQNAEGHLDSVPVASPCAQA